MMHRRTLSRQQWTFEDSKGMKTFAELTFAILTNEINKHLHGDKRTSSRLLTAENITGPDLVIHQPDEALDVMDDWCTKHHGESGLTAAVKASKISLSQAEQTVLDFVKQHTPPRACPLAGNSVHADKQFLDKYMPRLMDHLHYRIIDVSSIKELCWRWFPKVNRLIPRKKAQHRALEDIKESLLELKFYKQTIFIQKDID